MGTEANLLDDLGEAWDEHVKEEETEGVDDPSAINESELKDENSDDAEAPPAEATETTPDEPVEAEVQPPDTETETTEIDSAPVGLPADAREAWKDTPKAVQAAIAKREADYNNGIQKYAESAKRAEGMDQVLAPYQQYMATNGGPGQVIPGLLQTGAILQGGAPIQKAQVVANIIKQFGVDIKALDDLIVGEQPQVSQQQDVQQLVEQRFQQEYQQRQQYEQEQAQQYINSEVQTFATDPKNEFYNDVSDTMANLLDIAANQGKQMSLQDAYDEACQINPTVRNALQIRGNAADLDKKRQAAVSVAGTRGTDSSATPTSLRGTLEDAWDNLGRT